MKAVLCKSLDGPESLTIEDVPEPVASDGNVIVRVAAAGLNFADTLVTRGKYQIKPELPFSPGVEIAGTIDSIGAKVKGWQPGQRVMAYAGIGGAREKISIDAGALIALPAGVPDEIAAGLPVTYGTALHGLRDRARLKPGETVVVTGAAGGAGQAAVEIAKLMGGRVIAVASSQDKLKASGADLGIVFPGADLKLEVRSLTGGAGADVVYDCVGGDASEPLIRALAWQGRFLAVGFASGTIPSIPLNLLLLKGASASGVFWGESVRRDPAGHKANMQQLIAWVEDGRLKPQTDAVFPLSNVREALARIERREAKGKIVLKI